MSTLASGEISVRLIVYKRRGYRYENIFIDVLHFKH
jgi:hypothetical protein